MNVPRMLTGTAAAVALAALLFAAPQGAAAAAEGDERGEGTTWALAPATDGAADGRVSLRHEIAPGDRIEDAVLLTNFSPHAATFSIYPSDGLVAADGSFDLLPPGEPPVGGGTWIDLGLIQGSDQDPDPGTPVSVTVDAGASIVVPLTISIPDDAGPGDHPAGIVAQFVPDETSQVQVANRVGVRTHIRVDGPVVASIEAERVTVDYVPSFNPFAPGTVRVTYDLVNTGNVRLGAEGTAVVAGPFGWLETSQATEVREVLPGESTSATASLNVWPMLLGFGAVDVTAQIVGDDRIEQLPPTSTQPFTVWTVPWAQSALLVLIALIVVLAVHRRRRTRRRVQQMIESAVAEAERDRSAGEPHVTAGRDTHPVSADGEAPVSADQVGRAQSTDGGAVDSRATRRG
jgi:hypothetical protein